jgi:tRNA-splicing ligase RtcB
MDIINYSAEYENILYSWLPHDLKAEQIIFFPDACPGKSPLPTGTVVRTKQTDWRKFAVSDCGCGMLLAKSNVKKNDFDKNSWNKIYSDLKNNKGKLGDLGSGNHFLDAMEPYDENSIYFLIHTGSRDESKAVEKLVDDPEKFDKTFKDVCLWAENNRKTVLELIEKYFGKLELILDKNHNNFEMLNNGSVIIRKGAVKLMPDELTIIPSCINGDAVLVKAKEKITAALCSMSHGTGRIMSRSDAKNIAEKYDYKKLRQEIYIPDGISNESIKTEAPFCYRSLDDCLKLIENLVIEEKRFTPFAYLGQV